MSAAAGSERRRVPRRAFEAPLGLLVNGTYRMEWALRLGEGGVTITSREKLRLGQRVVVSFVMTNGLTIIVRGVVRNVAAAPAVGPKLGEGDRYGVEFENLEFHHKREIRSFVASAGGTGGAQAGN